MNSSNRRLRGHHRQYFFSKFPQAETRRLIAASVLD